jgi:hypothetical protein
LDELVEQRAARHQHVLVEVFSPYCHACERLQPVLEQVAHVLSMADRERGYAASAASSSSPAASFLVAVMDESKNHKPAFLTAEEERYLPVIKFFPLSSSSASGSQSDTGLTYNGPPNARAILGFINSSLPASQRIPSSTLSSLLASTSAAAFAAVQAVYRRQREEEVERDATILLFDHSPCGAEMKDMMEAMLLDRYRSDRDTEDDDEDPEAGEGGELMRRFRQCMQGKRKETQAYWKEIHKIASGQLRLEEQRSGDKHSDDKEDGEEKKTKQKQ